MARSIFDRLIVNPSREEPAQRWRYDHATRRFDLVPGAVPRNTSSLRALPPFDDPGTLLSTVRTPGRRQAADRPP